MEHFPQELYRDIFLDVPRGTFFRIWCLIVSKNVPRGTFFINIHPQKMSFSKGTCFVEYIEYIKYGLNKGNV